MEFRRSTALAAVLPLLGLVTAYSSRAARPPDTTVAHAPSDVEKDAFIRLAMRSDGLPGLQTVVVKNGRVVWNKSYGFAVLARPGPQRTMTNDAVLFSASVARIFVTVAVLQQAEQGRLSLDDDINKYVPFPVRNPAWPEVPITWRMLLTHTSSLEEEDDARTSATFTHGGDPQTALASYVHETFAPSGARRSRGRNASTAATHSLWRQPRSRG